MIRILFVAPDGPLREFPKQAEGISVTVSSADPVLALEQESFDGVAVGLDFLTLRIVAACDASGIPIVVLIPPGRSLEQLNAFGISQGLPASASWAEIADALGLGRTVIEHEPNENPSKPAEVIAVWGPTGAPGRTVIAINLAAELALVGHKVLLIDADTYGGAVAGHLELFDEAPGFLAAARMAQQGVLDEVELARVSHCVALGKASMTVLSGTVSSRRWPEITPTRIRAALEEFRARYDSIVVDVGFNLEEDEEIVSDLVGPRRNQVTLEMLRESDTVIAVAGSDVIGIARFIHSLDALREAADSARIVVVANRVRSERGSNGGVIKHTLSRFAGIDEVSLVSHDPAAFAASLESALPLCLAAPKSASRGQLRGLVTKVVTTQSAPALSPA
jgi:MinD-like ATPase involved in chromosome partitioning or flagellar assembly